MLELPPTVRLPQQDELPNNPEIFKKLKEREKARIIEGYVLKYNMANDLPFIFYAEVNINNSGFWKLFNALANLLPNEISCIYNLYNEEAIFSPYMDKRGILNFLQIFKLELTQDCNLEFGLLSNTKDELEEVFASDTKYFKVWSSKESHFRQIMNNFSLKEIPDLNFVDEFPKVVEPLTKFNNYAKRTELVIKELNNYFSN